MRLSIFGTGYVGLVTGACFSQLGHQVICLDIDEAKIAALQAGRIPIYEPGLTELVASNVEQGRLIFTTDVKRAVEESLVLFIAVGTPPGEDGSADMKYVLSVAQSIGQYINGYKIIVNKSTVPVGTAGRVAGAVRTALDERGATHQFDVVSNPEFLREGSAIQDFMNPDRIVIGADDARTMILMEQLYAGLVQDGRLLLTMSTASSEMTKYAANSMLAAKISFINEIANICECVGADITDVRNGIGADRRIGYYFISPGIGYGGSCFPKDVKALVRIARACDSDATLLNAVEDVNERQKLRLFEKLMTYYQGNVRGKRFAVWGLAFKPETDDVREAPALVIIDALAQAGARMCCYDPKAMEEAQHALGERAAVTYAEDAYSGLEGCDALILLTEWSPFRNPDFDRMKALLSTPTIFDGRNVFMPELMQRLGFDYVSIGRRPVFGRDPGA